jgi:uncharacterized protein YggE
VEQQMPNEPVISVRGEAVLEVEPEIAVVWVSVMARDKDRRRAVELLADRTNRITAQIKGYDEAVEKLDSGRVSVRPEFKDGKPRERIAGYVAQAALTTTVADFDVLGDLVTGLAGQEMVAVAGPDWQLRPGSPVHRQARLAAARDATQRAREYAEAFGGTITGLTEAADTGLLVAGQPPRRFVASAVGRAMTAAVRDEGPPEFDFEPAKQTVTAQVEARFTMTAPTLGQ